MEVLSGIADGWFGVMVGFVSGALVCWWVAGVASDQVIAGLAMSAAVRDARQDQSRLRAKSAEWQGSKRAGLQPGNSGLGSAWDWEGEEEYRRDKECFRGAGYKDARGVEADERSVLVLFVGGDMGGSMVRVEGYPDLVSFEQTYRLEFASFRDSRFAMAVYVEEGLGTQDAMDELLDWYASRRATEEYLVGLESRLDSDGLDGIGGAV